MHLLPCLSRWQVRRFVHIQNKLFPQLGSRDVEFWNPQCTQQHQRRPAEAEQEYFQRLVVPLAFATAKSALYSVRSPPKNVGSSGQQMSWHRVESAFFLRHGEGKRRRSLLSTRACSRSKMKSLRGRAGRRGAWARVSREYRRLRAFPIWGIHIQTKSTLTSFAVLMVLGGGGGGGGGI